MNEISSFIKNSLQYLSPPGFGLLSDNLKFFSSSIGESTQECFIHTVWKKKIENIAQSSKKFFILGIPYDNGCSLLRGSNQGPRFFRKALRAHTETFFDVGDIRVISQFTDDEYLNNHTLEVARESLYGPGSNLPVSPINITYDFAHNFFKNFPNKTLFSIGGDHSASQPLIKAFIESRKAISKKIGIIQFDAHLDMSVPKHGLNFTYGSWVTSIVNLLDSPENLVQIGIRRSDDNLDTCKRFGQSVFFSDEFDDFSKISHDILLKLQNLDVDEFYLTIDVDCLDPKEFSCTGKIESNGIKLLDFLTLIKSITSQLNITAIDIMEYAPNLQHHEVPVCSPQHSVKIMEKIISSII